MLESKKKQILLYLNAYLKPLKSVILTIREFLKNEKKEFSKIIRTAWAEFYVEYDIAKLKKISLYLILLLWILFQAYYYNNHSHFFISHDEYVELKKILAEQESIENFYEDVIKGQQNKIKKLEHVVDENNRVTSSAKLIFFLSGLATYAFMMMWATWK